MDEVDRAIKDLKPDSFKGYTIGDNTNKDLSAHPWRMDDEKLVYPFYDKLVKAGIVNVCVHKGLFPPSVEQQFPKLLPYCDVRDVGKAANDWPNLNFIIYHGGYRLHPGGSPEQALRDFEQRRKRTRAGRRAPKQSALRVHREAVTSGLRSVGRRSVLR